ncbi:hypothetical protein RGQ13_08665 [Thalassotalea psychrophila]|uniref:Uncharacterized protein n=1 Tax=Thalassotalea psychrophila TaxID=3065647 RepID=A0ABY9TZ24_9GAMM|nr:hypothetical protein RGQ13_08665 [Colwelliaceae bacterium SQ149]
MENKQDILDDLVKLEARILEIHEELTELTEKYNSEEAAKPDANVREYFSKLDKEFEILSNRVIQGKVLVLWSERA